MNGFNMKTQVVSGDQIDKNSIIYDPYSDNVPSTLPNVELILDDVIKILECMNTDEMQTLKSSNKELFEQVMEDKFPQFSDRYYGMFKMVLSGEDISPLFKMLDVIGNINAGKTSFETGEKDVGTYLKKFLPEGLVQKLESGEVTPEMIQQKYKQKGKH